MHPMPHLIIKQKINNIIIYTFIKYSCMDFIILYQVSLIIIKFRISYQAYINYDG